MRFSNPIESIGRHPRLAATVAAGLVGVAALEGVGFASNGTSPIPGKACETPLAASQIFGRDGNLATQLSGIGYGVTATADVPKNALGEVGAFANPGRGWHISQMVPATGREALKFTIGGGDVRFAVAEVLPEGSPECKVVPDITFTEQDPKTYVTQEGRLPFPNPANVAIQDLSFL
jgi:hypothetical protein